jgi:hypothetical protein
VTLEVVDGLMMKEAYATLMKLPNTVQVEQMIVGTALTMFGTKNMMEMNGLMPVAAPCAEMDQ